MTEQPHSMPAELTAEDWDNPVGPDGTYLSYVASEDEEDADTNDETGAADYTPAPTVDSGTPS